LLDAIDRFRCLNAGGLEKRRHDIDHMVELGANATKVLDVTGPRNRHPLTCAAKMGGDLFAPLERSVECPRPRNRKMRKGLGAAPSIIEIFQLISDRNIDTIERSDFIWSAPKRTFNTCAIVAADKNDQRVVKLAHVLDGLNDPANLVVRVGEVSGVNIRLSDKHLLFVYRQRLSAASHRQIPPAHPAMPSIARSVG